MMNEVELVDNKDGSWSFVMHLNAFGMKHRKVSIYDFEAEEELALKLFSAFDLGRSF